MNNSIGDYNKHSIEELFAPSETTTTSKSNAQRTATAATATNLHTAFVLALLAY